MKTDLIRKEDAIKAIFDWMDTHKREVLHKQDVAEVIMNLPSAMGKGEWSVSVTPSTLGYFEYTCSECGEKAYEATKYCGHCGSYMWGRKE